MRWFREKNGKVKGGERLQLLVKSEEWVNYFAKVAGNGMTNISKCSRIRSKLDRDLNLMYFGETKGSPLYKVYKKQAKNRDHMVNTFSFFTAPAECAEAYGASAPGIAMFRRFDKFQPVPYTGEPTTEAVLDFVDKNFHPDLIDFTLAYAEPIFRFAFRTVFLLSETKKGAYQEPFAQAATDLRGKALFVKSGISRGDGPKLKNAIRVEKEDLPALFVQEPSTATSGPLKYKYEGDLNEITTEKIGAFLEDIKAGDIPRWVLSEPLPKKDKKMKAIEVVGKTWNKLVMKDDSKYALIWLYRS